ncbi:MAG: hypothetical protein CL678_14490 [Bdellovibrionaceae bacterium]|nr:hypothetical protein [Pseudobdellovibrionaceae bacterium]
MYNLKGFLSIAAYADNAVGVVAPIGELSTLSSTYAKEKGQYTSEATPNVELVTFSSKQDDTLVPVPAAISNHVLSVGEYIYNRSVTGAIGQDSENFLLNLVNEFPSTMFQLTCGEFVTDGTYWLPEWISWKYTPDQGDTTIKIWLADESFALQYDEFEVVVVPPVIPVDQLYNGYNTVKALIDAFTMPVLSRKIEVAREEYPYTKFQSDMYDWVDQNDPETTIPTPWTVLVYGIAGDNIDVIKTALQDWILENSVHTREEWVEVLPDLFRRTEFVICPFWDKYSVPNRTTKVGLYSPQSSFVESMALGKRTAVGYPPAHVEAHLNSSAFMYRSIGFTSIGGEENRDDLFELYQVFSDYITVSTDSPDFNRMDPVTQRWVELIYEMLPIAEYMTEFTSVPVGMSKLIRGDILYLVASYQDIQYLVVAKSSLVDLGDIEIPDPVDPELPEEVDTSNWLTDNADNPLLNTAGEVLIGFETPPTMPSENYLIGVNGDILTYLNGDLLTGPAS